MAMSPEDIVKAVRTRFKAQVADQIAGLLVQYDNSPFNKTEGTRWVRFSVLPGESSQASFGAVGSRRFRTVGIALVSIFTPSRLGDNSAYEIIEYVKTAFRAVTAGGVIYKVPTIAHIGLHDSGEWQINVTCPFYSDDEET